MKSTLALLLLIITCELSAQDTTIKKVDTAYIPKTAIAIKPLVVNMQGDSVYSFTWAIVGLSRDTSVPVTLNVNILDRSGNPSTTQSFTIPAYYVNKGINIASIDNFIFNRIKRLIRK